MPNSRSGIVLRKLDLEQVGLDPEERKGEADRGEREGDRIADQQEDHEPGEHVGSNGDRLHAHCTGFS